MKTFKRLLSVFLVLATFFASFAGSYALATTGTTEFDPLNLSVFDGEQNNYYLRKAPADIKFQVVLTGIAEPSYSLVDSTGAAILPSFEKVTANTYNIAPPTEGYRAGEQYTLILGPGVSFVDENLRKTRVLVFNIEREAAERFTFTEAVVETNQSIEELSETTISVASQNVKNGDIIFGSNASNEHVVYRIEELLDDGTAVVSIPAIDEIYSELEVCGQYEFDVNDIVANPDLEIEIIENVKESPFYASLITSAYAADSPKAGAVEASISPDSSTNRVKIQIKITLKPGENGLFGIAELKQHAVILTLSETVGLTMDADIQGASSWDVAANISSDFAWNIEIARTIKKGDGDSTLEDLFGIKDEYKSYDNYLAKKQIQKNVKKISDALNLIAADATGGELKLFDWNLPVPSVPGLYFSAEIYAFYEYKVVASAVIGSESKTTYSVGICYRNQDFKTYSNVSHQKSDVSLSIRGKASAKAGIKLSIKAVLISDKLACIELDPQAGLYADFYATIPILGVGETSKFWYAYFEPGVYFGASINATLNILVKKYDVQFELIEKKFPIKELTFGTSKIYTGIAPNATTVRANDNMVFPPDIYLEYYDVKKAVNASGKISLDDLKFVASDGTQLRVEDGMLVIPENVSGNTYVTASYMHSNGTTYSTVFCVLISGSVLEGKVSAYAEDYSTSELEGATVKLYSSANSTTFISTQRTDENGKFSFNVSAGDYRLEISANGYRTLTSTQSVAENEIKYTEHILLMDDTQSGLGSAGGTVANALDGKGINGVQIKLRNNWNNTSGAYVEDFGTTTTSSGRYSISNVPVGYYTVEASLFGYVTGYSNIMVLSENERTDFDFTITPELSDGEVRIVLTWGDRPSDLDSHLVGRTPSEDGFRVFYADRRYKYEGVEMANLDVDDVSSYGPETITILKNIYGTYTYAVHNYSHRGTSNSTDLSFSGAVVRVFIGSHQVAEYHVPTDQVGTYWTVFQIDRNKTITPVNLVSNTRPEA